MKAVVMKAGGEDEYAVKYQPTFAVLRNLPDASGIYLMEPGKQ
jgi:hypothetical protein